MALQCYTYIAMSLDGFIAREDGDISWLEDEAYKIKKEDYGYKFFFDNIDTLVIGRKTYESVLSFPQWPYESKRVLVLSHSPQMISVNQSENMEAANLSPAELVWYLDTTGSHNVYVDGGTTIQGFLQAGLINEMVITTIPILLGKGIKLFGKLEHDIKLNLRNVTYFKNGFIQTRYSVRQA